MKCPYCAENIKDEAIVCAHCRRDLTFFKPIDKRLQAIDSELKDLTEHVSRISNYLDQQQSGGTKEGTKEGETAPTGKLKKPTKWRIFLIVLLEFLLVLLLLVITGNVLADLDPRYEQSYYVQETEQPQTSPSPAATAESTPAAVINSGDQAQPNSLCALDEQIIFSCPLKSAEIVSVCASKELTSDRGYLQYRFGLPGKIEFEYPKDRQRTQEKFQHSYYSRSQDNPARTHIHFNVDGDKYKVFDASDGRGATRQGVSVITPGQPEVSWPCATQATVDYGDLWLALEVNESELKEEKLKQQLWLQKKQSAQQQFDRRTSMVFKIMVAASFVLPIALGLWIGIRWQGRNLKRYLQVGLLCVSVKGAIVALFVILIFIGDWGEPHYPGKITLPLMFAALFILIDLFRCLFGFATGGFLGDWIERRRYPQLYGRGFSDLMALKRSNRRENLGRFARVTHGLGGLTSSVAPLVPLMGVIITSVIGYYAAQAAKTAKEADVKAKAAAEENEKRKQSDSKPADTAPAQSPQPSVR